MTSKNKTCDKKLKRLCKAIVKVRAPWATIIWDVPPRGAPSWDGKVLHIVAPGDPEGLIYAAHDAAHFVVCSKRRLRQPEFGLGRNPANPDADVKRIVQTDRAVAEELEACTIHLALVAYTHGIESTEEVAEYLSFDLPTLPVDISRQAIDRLERVVREATIKKLIRGVDGVKIRHKAIETFMEIAFNNRNGGE